MNTTRRSFLVSGCKLALTPAALSITRFASASAPTEGGLADLSASSAIDAMKKGEMKAEAYMTALLDRAARFSKLNAFRTLNREKALESAAMADRLRATGSPLGLLHGLPIPVKDSFNSATLPTSNGTASMRDWVPRQDATTLSLIISRGALLMGKTNLHEMSFGWTSNNDEFGAVLNPYDTSRVPGGSSGGSAVAVSARMAPLALGEDTLGSIRVPASMCGVVGFRPTLGRYPSAGIMPLTNNKFDQPGPIARCVADIALFDAAMLGQTSPVVAMPMNGTRIGVPSSLFEGTDPDVDRIVRAALNKLAGQGITLVPLDFPASIDAALGIANTLINYEMMLAVEAYLVKHGAPVNFDQMMEQSSSAMRRIVQRLALPPNRPSRSSYEEAISRQAMLIEDLQKLFVAQRITAIAFPPILISPPKIGDNGPFSVGGKSVPMYVAMARNTSLASCARMPSLVLPAGLTSNSLPVGIEFASISGRDSELIALALSLEGMLGIGPAPILQ